jgi:tRNA modification GTPase
MSRSTDTIAALATPSGTAALAVIRITGPDTKALARATLGRTPAARRAVAAAYRDLEGQTLDQVLATLFEGPRSYTGEDALELSCHGNPYIVRSILADLLARGCRPAGPGEFTQRAFLNGRMDLSQAEAVMDVISARGARSLAAAQALLSGALGRHVSAVVDAVLGALARVEAYIDFPEEDLPEEDRGLLMRKVESALAGVDRMLATERTGALLRDGISTVIIGEPNAGKSSLLNRLAGSDRAIVSPEPGTTRDFIEVLVNAGPHCLRLIDTAGLNPLATGVEAIGVARTLEWVGKADLLVLVADATAPLPALPASVAGRIHQSTTLFVVNKSDLLPAGAPPRASGPAGLTEVRVSAATGTGIDALWRELERMADGLQQTLGEERIAINVRHAHHLGEARAGLSGAAAKIAQKGPQELVASDLRSALAALGEIAGKVDNERMLDQLFASFCIGK